MGSYEYEVDGQKVVLQREEHLVAVRFKEPARQSTRHRAATSAGVTRFESRLEVPNEKYTIFDLRAKQRAAAVASASHAMKALESSGTIDRATPVFSLGTAKMFASDRVNVGVKPGIDIQKIAQSVGGTVIESLGDNEHVLKLPENGDPLSVAKALAARKSDVEYAEPDFVNVVPKLARKSSHGKPVGLDAFTKQQYAVHLTQADAAWALIQGRPEIKIAILDEGVDTAHEDLRDAIFASYDAADNDTYQEPNPWDGHGTACAGLAAATHNSTGVQGIGGGCSLMAVRIAYSKVPGGDWVITNSGTARAIEWSWTNGADVLSNSWGGGAPSTMVARAFERARTKGRGGKGCVLIIAAGNENQPVAYPATLPNVVCVSASNEHDEPKTKTSHDGETWWGSSYGAKVTLAAPGVHNYTTDISGTGGYNQGPNDANYIPDFNGTSSSTPIVAGAVGLMLSAKATLTEAQVRKILVETCEKVGGQYDGHGHHPRMGYGRLNVLRAVEKALAHL